MYTDIPLFKRCCICLPLRPGLIAWGYIKLIVNILSLIYFAYILCIWVYNIEFISIRPVLTLSFLIIGSVLDTVFGIVFLVSAHLKSYKLMKIYYKYCVVMLILTVVLTIGFLLYICVRIGSLGSRLPVYVIVDVMLTYAGAALCVCFEAMLFIYMVLLVRSEVLKLESNLQCKFVKTAASVDDDGKKEVVERAFYNRLSSDPGSVYTQCTIDAVE